MKLAMSPVDGYGRAAELTFLSRSLTGVLWPICAMLQKRWEVRAVAGSQDRRIKTDRRHSDSFSPRKLRHVQPRGIHLAGCGYSSQAEKWPWKFRANTGGLSPENTHQSVISDSRKKLTYNKPWGLSTFPPFVIGRLKS